MRRTERAVRRRAEARSRLQRVEHIVIAAPRDLGGVGARRRLERVETRPGDTRPGDDDVLRRSRLAGVGLADGGCPPHGDRAIRALHHLQRRAGEHFPQRLDRRIVPVHRIGAHATQIGARRQHLQSGVLRQALHRLCRIAGRQLEMPTRRMSRTSTQAGDRRSGEQHRLHQIPKSPMSAHWMSPAPKPFWPSREKRIEAGKSAIAAMLNPKRLHRAGPIGDLVFGQDPNVTANSADARGHIFRRSR